MITLVKNKYKKLIALFIVLATLLTFGLVQQTAFANKAQATSYQCLWAGYNGSSWGSWEVQYNDWWKFWLPPSQQIWVNNWDCYNQTYFSWELA